MTLGRALDRADQQDSAARVYLRAAAALPSVASWLRLRAAGVTSDSAARSALYRDVSLPAAVTRIRWTEALARERTGDLPGAARALSVSPAVPAGAISKRANCPSKPSSSSGASGTVIRWRSIIFT